MKWSVGAKVATGFFLVIAVILAMAAVRVVQNQRVAEQVDELYARGVLGTERLSSADSLLHRMRALTLHHVASEDRRTMQKTEQLIREYENRFLLELDGYLELLPPADPRRARVASVRERYAELARIREQQVLPQSDAANTTEALQYAIVQSGAVFNQTSEILRELITDNIAVNRAVERETHDALSRANVIAWSGSLLVVGLAVLVAWLTARSISSRLRDLSEVAVRVSKGDLSERAKLVGSDEITDVAGALNEMTAALAAKIEAEKAAADDQLEERQKLARTIESYARFVDRVARGELGAELEVRGEGDMARLGENLQAMGRALRTMTLGIHEAVGALSAATAQILTTVQEHGASANESASAVAETVATVDEVQQSARGVADAARHVAIASRQSVEVSDSGREAVDNAVRTMEDVRREVDAIAARILALSEQAGAVGQIINTVNELAEQSNLLALNASIEAARAGEEGRGFAVVAQEIRALADQSRQATAEVRTILGEIQRSTGEAVLATEQGSRAVGRAAEAVQSSGTQITQLGQTVAESAQSAQQIENAAQQQVQGVTQISQAMHSIREASRQSVEGSRNIESAARSLNELAERLRDAVAQYRA